ncbi:MAG: DUF1906 domain-containing protein, partial [Actinomycetota bacterium]|nr:DUF1906 domain-containing protein [Actinomycetota bacterium]
MTSRDHRRGLSAVWRLLLTGLATLALALAMLATVAPAQAVTKPNPVTPGNLTGYGFDQCTAPSQSAMTAWMDTSPFLAVGIYLSGDSRGCTSQPNLTPTWVRTQLAAGWRLLPLTLGPQAWCTTRPRYLRQVRISPSPATSYEAARIQGSHEAARSINAARSLGITPGSTMWYDIEAFDTRRSTACTQSAMWFLSSWTRRMHSLGYLSGVYSSAASGIQMLDDARVSSTNAKSLPDRVWIADWNGRANTSSAYVRSDGWMPHRRVHQYQGGHDETWGGVRINIDRSWVDLGIGSVPTSEPAHCGGVRLGF